uniref:Uncharacterized protein n=1 Tax=Meloidogyne incognita TaxID=6306 RepID=A0A914NZE6_MELIC
MMFKLAEALGRLALAGREMTRLAGFTSRVDMLLNVLNDLENGKYQRTMILDMNNTNQTRQGNSGEINGKLMDYYFLPLHHFLLLQLMKMI